MTNLKDCKHINVNDCAEDCSARSCANCTCDNEDHLIHCMGMGLFCSRHGWYLPIGSVDRPTKGCWHCWYEDYWSKGRSLNG